MSGANSRVNVILAGSYRETLNGYRKILDREQHMEVVAEAEHESELLRRVEDLKPDVVVVDIGLPDRGTLWAINTIPSVHESARILAVSAHNDSRYVLRALHAGAIGYMLWDRASQELAQAVRAVAGGRIYMSPGIAGIVSDDEPVAAIAMGAF